MENTAGTVTFTVADLASKVLVFISNYREMESTPYDFGYSLINYLFHEKPKLASHLRDHWKSKKKGFGAFYLNLDNKCAIALLTYWGLDDKEEFDAYLEKVKAGEDSNIFEEAFPKEPELLLAYRNVLLFFENHGISKEIYGILFPRIPLKSKDCFGNSANWGKYILSLPEETQLSTIVQILTNYKG